MKKEYIKPYIKKQTAGVMNKFGVSYNKGHREEIEGHLVSEFTDHFGSPVFVLSEKVIRERYRKLYSYFSSKYPKAKMSWSYKTNYLDAVCSIMHQEGETAEVVSDFEYQKARRLGVPGKKIIYNGPYKPIESLIVAFREGAMVNLDNFDEIIKAEEAAKQLDIKTPVGIRVNMDTGVYPQWSRFGFNIENNNAFNAVKRIQHSDHLYLDGIHCHIGTFMLEPNAYKEAVKKVVALMRRIEKEFEISISYLDFGGGFPSNNKLKGTYLPPEVAIQPIENFIDAIADTLLEELEPKEYPDVYLETGRAIVDEAGWLITTVDAIKRLPDGTKSYIIDAGVNLLYTSSWYNYKVEIDRELHGAYENSIIYGPLCMNIDVVVESAFLPPLPKGTRLILSPMGAYNVTQWMQFIRYRPAVALIMEDGTVEEIRRIETLEDIVGPESIPDKLKKFHF
ncbi:MAG: diaminopimelate decarboxylase [Candidatus Delongbacteria bacterium]|nr:diaminopimelate decarboxylase [Candidatus Delongbacteria bacterium]MCG2760253.1 diaminopimelate decarboxylase [Candidatus Delongbacteria bacterium]